MGKFSGVPVGGLSETKPWPLGSAAAIIRAGSNRRGPPLLCVRALQLRFRPDLLFNSGYLRTYRNASRLFSGRKRSTKIARNCFLFNFDFRVIFSFCSAIKMKRIRRKKSNRFAVQLFVCVRLDLPHYLRRFSVVMS